MLPKLLMPFLLNTLLLFGVQDLHANHSFSDSDQYNIARSQILDTRVHRKNNSKSAGEIIKAILKRKKRTGIPPVIEQKIMPPMEYYLDPPKFSVKDRSKLA